MINSKIRPFSFRKINEGDNNLFDKKYPTENNYSQSQRMKQNNTNTINENSINIFLKNKSKENIILNINNVINYNTTNNNILSNENNENNKNKKDKDYYINKLKDIFLHLKRLIIFSYFLILMNFLLIFYFPKIFCCFINIFSLCLILIFLILIFILYVKENINLIINKKLIIITKKIIITIIIILIIYIIDTLYIFIFRFLLNIYIDYEINIIIKGIFIYMSYMFFNLLNIILILNALIKIKNISYKINKFDINNDINLLLKI